MQSPTFRCCEPDFENANTGIGETASTSVFDPCLSVSVHCHDLGLFYAAASLKNLEFRERLQLFMLLFLENADTVQLKKYEKWWYMASWSAGKLGYPWSLASYADTVRVGESTGRKSGFFTGLNGVVIRNGITIESDKIDWDWKKMSWTIRKFLSETCTNITEEKIRTRNDNPDFHNLRSK